MTQQYKIGDTVKVLKSDYPAFLPVGTITTVVKANSGGGEYLRAPGGDSLYFTDDEIEIVEQQTPEVGDTVEVTNAEGTLVRGVVLVVGALGGLTFAGADIFVPVNSTTSVTVIEKVKKPKVWAVGDVVKGWDYASETIKDGTLVGTPNDSVIKRGDKWIDCQSGVRYPLDDLSAARTIVYIP